ncbi:orexin receptor type 2-like isoform X2 [Pecten maximus]|nr:orexin receptor type 2-like isoform X2 [Pecten maximus]XP_033727069.1 orexin receptor type 2-like isoform X2 [Pecten maximus]
MNETISGDNSTASNDTEKQCHTWLADELPSFSNVTLEDLNSQLVRRNIGGICLLSVFVVIGLIGNIHVLYIYLRQFRTSNYKVYVLYLAIMDVINCTVVAPLVITYLFFPMTYPSVVLCKAFRFCLYLFSIASTSSMVVIAIDRHRKICSPLGPQFTIRKAKLLCVGSFVFSIILSWPATILYGLSSIETGIPGMQTGYRCYTHDDYKGSMYQVVFHLILTLYFIAVTTLLIIAYIKIGRHIHAHRKFQSSIRRMSARSEQEIKMATGNAARKTTWTLCAVTIVYILCALPHHTLALLIFINKNFDCELSLLGSQIYYTFIWSYFANSVVNPFIYGIRDRKFRFEFRNMYRR